MSDIEELQRRITAAMDRVAQGIDRIDATPAGPDPETLQALEEERTANAQLTERVRALKQKAEADSAASGDRARAELDALRAQSDAEISDLRARNTEAAAQAAALDDQLQRLRQSHDELLSQSAALRAANAEGVGDPDLINRTLETEVASLTAARAADMAEAEAILSALAPLLETDNPDTTEREAS